MMLSGWAGYPIVNASVSAPRGFEDLRLKVLEGEVIARGNGRAYGDSAINKQNTVHMKHLNRILDFDEVNGQLVAEAGVILGDINLAVTQRGFFPFVTPGTKFVTLGGMIAADVHGKNHHIDGSFGNFVEWIDILVEDGSIQHCSRIRNPDLFNWTIGGMGLTGIIIRAAIRLRPIKSVWIKQETLVAKNLSHAIDLMENSTHCTYSVAWIDCLKKGNSLGRGLVMLGEHAELSALPSVLRNTPFEFPYKSRLALPFNLPNFLMNRYTVRIFNHFYYELGKRKPRIQLIDLNSYFYPLDSILGWNKIYGRNGFLQYQCVLPLQCAEKGLNELINKIADAGSGSFLAVLKRFGSP